MAKERPAYLSYLLRLWRVDDDGEPYRYGGESGGEGTAAWRASLQSARTGERQTFASLDEVVDYLREQMGVSLDLEVDEQPPLF